MRDKDILWENLRKCSTAKFNLRDQCHLKAPVSEQYRNPHIDNLTDVGWAIDIFLWWSFPISYSLTVSEDTTSEKDKSSLWMAPHLECSLSIMLQPVRCHLIEGLG